MDAPQLSPHELDNMVSFSQKAILSLPRSHPLRAHFVQLLAIMLSARYDLSSQQDDLEQSILRHTEMIFLPLPWDQCPLNFFQIFFTLAITLFRRADESRQAKDLERPIMYLRYLRRQSLDAFDVRLNHVTGYLVRALEIQVELELGDVKGDIEEMASLCRELLDSDISTATLASPILALVRAFRTQRRSWTEGQVPPKEVIECLREANIRLPDLHEVSFAFALSLFSCFAATHTHDDYEEGTTVLDKIIAFRGPGDKPSQSQESALGLIAGFASVRSSLFGKPEYSEEAIRRIRAFHDGISLEDPSRPGIMRLLALYQQKRFDDFGVKVDLQDAHSRNSRFSGNTSFRELSVLLASASSGKSPQVELEIQHISALISALQTPDVADIEEAIKYCRVFLASSHFSGELVAMADFTLGALLQHAFMRTTNKTEYLNEAISIFRGHLNSPRLQQVQFSTIQRITECLFLRFNILHHRQDFNEIMQLFPVAANDERAKTPERFVLSCVWATLARRFRHPSALTAYRCAMSLLQDSVTFSPTLHIQHSRLVTLRGHYENLPSDYASFQVHTGRLHQAIETLERGRALLWSEMRGLRTSIDQLRAANSRLADRFAAVNRDLEMLTLTDFPTNVNGEDGVVEGMDPFGHLVVRQRKLFNDRDKLISQIQAMPGFETFLKSPSFDNLRSAAAHGPVIMINHCRWRSDILILLHDSPPSLIPTPNGFYARANKLRDQLLDARKKGLESNEYEDALCSVLKDLYDLVGRQVIQRLNELGVPEQSRVWLCPTSALCSLPLHAMGPIPSDGATKRYFLDLYIPSYTPTLSALIESNKPGSQMLDKPSILLVVQPDASMEEALEEMQIVQAVRTGVTTLISARATPSAVLERLRDHRFAHFVCHGILEAGKPFDASFKLYKDRHLTLLDIARSRLPNAEFAFLSACHTAELTDESIADEALHLTAAIQFCGFRSVVGTMWAMADTDGQNLARDFYKSVFSSRRRGVRYYERTAEALRYAVRELRKKRRMRLERWVNFVHFGA
ncbi:CHAT domain-containing protein [Russula compacta]|nr:CHAT domain-containing protein [Russula compacta]